METWTFLFWMALHLPARQVSVQNEDACVLLAKTVTANMNVFAMCVNEMDGKALFFDKGKQVERF